MKFFFFTAMVVAFFASLSFGQDGTAGSALAFARINNSSIQSCDLLIEAEVYEDRLDGLDHRKTIYRISLDYETKEGLLLKRGEALSAVKSSKIKGGRVENKQLSRGFLVNNKSGYLRNFPQRASLLPSANFSEIAAKMNCPNPRLFGLLPLGESYNWGKSSLDRFYQLQSIATYRSSGPQETTVEAFIATPSENVDRYLTWSLDNASNVTNRIRLISRLVDEKKDVPTNAEMIEWKELDGIKVPVEIFSEDGVAVVNDDGEEELYERQTFWSISWLALNGNGNRLIASREILDDIQEFRKQTDIEVLKGAVLVGPDATK
ncbi:MAG: hypothetical protein AB8B50_15815 [Pirellulaceae bacterium]